MPEVLQTVTQIKMRLR